jgi:hypothetical protein
VLAAAKKTIVDINPENTPFSYEMDFSIRQTAVEGLSRLMSIFDYKHIPTSLNNDGCA